MSGDQWNVRFGSLADIWQRNRNVILVGTDLFAGVI
jgi:hypothetical protein